MAGTLIRWGLVEHYLSSVSARIWRRSHYHLKGAIWFPSWMVASVKGEYPQFPSRGNCYHLKGSIHVSSWDDLSTKVADPVSKWMQQRMTLIEVEKVMAPSVKQWQRILGCFCGPNRTPWRLVAAICWLTTQSWRIPKFYLVVFSLGGEGYSSRWSPLKWLICLHTQLNKNLT